MDSPSIAKPAESPYISSRHLLEPKRVSDVHLRCNSPATSGLCAAPRNILLPEEIPSDEPTGTGSRTT